MTEEAKIVVAVLRDRTCLIDFGVAAHAADLIEKLSADLESEERRYGRDAFATLADEGVRLEAMRDAWKRRAKALERELRGECWCCKHARKIELEDMRSVMTRFICEYAGKRAKPVDIADTGLADCKDWEWRGPCAENGGEHNADKG